MAATATTAAGSGAWGEFAAALPGRTRRGLRWRPARSWIYGKPGRFSVATASWSVAVWKENRGRAASFCIRLSDARGEPVGQWSTENASSLLAELLKAVGEEGAQESPTSAEEAMGHLLGELGQGRATVILALHLEPQPKTPGERLIGFDFCKCLPRWLCWFPAVSVRAGWRAGCSIRRRLHGRSSAAEPLHLLGERDGVPRHLDVSTLMQACADGLFA